MMRRVSALAVVGGLLLSSLALGRAEGAVQATQAKPPDPAKAGEATPKQPPAAKAGQATVKPAPAAPPGQAAQPPKPGAPTQQKPAAPAVATRGVPPPPGYIIGPDDVLQVLFRYDRDLTTDVTVRPDGMISLPMLSDVQAAGLTPEQLRDKITESAKRFIEDPAVTVIVRTINSRKVFITGQVTRPGPYALTAPTTVLQLIAVAGGLTEFAKQKNISVMRVENGKQVRYPFNYKDAAKGKNLKQNIELKPGDTVIVP